MVWFRATSAATVTMLRSRVERSGRFHTSPCRVPSAYFSRAGATLLRSFCMIVCSVLTGAFGCCAWADAEAIRQRDASGAARRFILDLRGPSLLRAAAEKGCANSDVGGDELPGPVLLLADLFQPVYVLAANHIGDGDMAHGGGCCCAMPVLHARGRPDDVARLDLALLAPLFLNPPRPGGDDQDLACGMGVPGRTGGGGENHLPAARRRVFGRPVQGLDDHVSREVCRGSLYGRSGPVRRDDRALCSYGARAEKDKRGGNTDEPVHFYFLSSSQMDHVRLQTRTQLYSDKLRPVSSASILAISDPLSRSALCLCSNQRRYCSSVTCSIHSTAFPFTVSWMAMCVMAMVAEAPCQCFSPGGNQTTSPGRISSTGPASRCTQPRPETTIRVWPRGWVCHAVRAPGSKVTLAPPTRAGLGALNSGSTRTVPVNHSAGPFPEACDPTRLMSIVVLPWRALTT